MTSIETGPFNSMAALRAANVQLGELRRSQGGDAAFVAAVHVFLARGSTTGALLAEEDERWSAQGLLDYWAAALERTGGLTPEATLAEFDPLMAPALPDEACPYLGLDAFDEANAALFFGRRRVVADLVERLHAHRLLAVVGPSGSGKSSLVRAGLLPALRADGVPGSAGWHILPPMVPGSNPVTALDRVLGAESGDRLPILDPRSPLPDPVLLIIDQFEETFTLCTDEARRAAFLARLVALVTGAGAAHRVVLTMRSDFEPFIARAEALHPLYEVGKVTLPPLTASELRETIERPAEQVGLKFESGLVDSLMGDILGEPAALPLLQYSLLKLWETRERNRATMAAYRKVSGGRLALARGADAAYAALIPEEQMTARRILLRLVRPGEGLEITSNRVRRSELNRGGEDPGRVARVMEKLVEARLLRLTSGDTADDTQVEVAHEALVRNWPTLVEWLEDERIALRQRQRLSAAAEQWQRMGRDPSALLAGRLLEDARQYDDLSESEREFVAASQSTADATRLRDIRAARQLRWLSIGMGIAALTALIFAIVALQLYAEANTNAVVADDQRGTAVANGQLADNQRGTAVANGQLAGDQQATAVASQMLAQTARANTEQQREAVHLAFQSQSQIHDAPESSLLLAYEGVKRDSNVVTRQSLLDALAVSVWAPLVLSGHTGFVHVIAFSPNGQFMATGGDDTTARIWDTSGHLVATLVGHTALLGSIAFDSDSQRIVTASNDNTARVWDLKGNELFRLSGHQRAVAQAAFSPDGSQIVTASWDTTIRLWHLVDQTSLVLTGHKAPVLSATFSSDGKYVLTTSIDRTARIWNSSGRLITSLGPHNDEVVDAAFSPDGQRIVTASKDGYARIWNMEGKLIASLRGHAGIVNSAQFSPDGQRVLTCSDDATARLWDLNGNELVIFSGHTREVRHARFSTNGRRVLTASLDGTARLWDLQGQQLATLSGHTAGVIDARFDLQDRHILTASDDQTARFWSLTGQELGTLGEHRLGVMDVSVNPDGDRILTASWDGTARLWSSNGEAIAEFRGHTGGVTGAMFTPARDQVLTVSDDGTARLWDFTGKPLHVFVGHQGGIIAATFSPDGQKLVTVSFDRTARIWALSGDLIAVLRHKATVVSAVFSADGQHILTAAQDGNARIWDLSGKELGSRLQNPDGTDVVSALFSPDGQLVLTSSRAGMAYLWDVSGHLIHTLNGHSGPVSAIFSPDGQTILTVSWDRTARLWDLKGVPRAVLVGHNGVIVSGVFSPDGQTILTASWDHTARLWNYSGDLLATFSGHRDRVVRAIFSPDGKRVLTASWDGTAHQYSTDVNHAVDTVACQIGRALTPEEIARFQVPTPLAFDFAKRQCPPVYSWQAQPNPVTPTPAR